MVWRFEFDGFQNKYSRKLLPKPPGFVSEADNAVEEGAISSADKELAAKKRQIMEIAYSPGKSLLSTGFMLWMSGSSIQIFSIMMTSMAIINPLSALSSVGKTFSKFDGEDGVDTRMAKLIFIALQIVSLAVALYKCNSMGLLPLTSADWLQNIPYNVYNEHISSPL